MRSQIILFSILLNFSLAITTNYLPRGSSISVEYASSNLLISPDKTFTCGFYTFNGTTNAYFFSIWFTNSKDKTVVWTANRGKPVHSRGSRVTLRKDGALVLTDLGGSNVWQTNTSLIEVDRAELLNSGNLVLKNTLGTILWQSFDFPTDTLLPTQLFTKNQKLVSRISPLMFASGYFSFFFDNDNVLKMVYDGPEISSLYWPDPNFNVFLSGRTVYNNSRIAILDDMGTFVSSDQLQFSASDMGFELKRRLTIDYDGNFRLYSLNNLSGLWTITWQAISQQCTVHGLCGRNAICVYTPAPKCSCPPYYEPFNSSDWSKGCKPKFDRSCSDSQFLEMPHVRYFGFDLNNTKNISFKDCRQLCLGDCRCQAFQYEATWEGTCVTKFALFNGYRPFEARIYLRIPNRAQVIELNTLNVSRLQCDPEPNIVLSSETYYDTSKQSFNWVYLYSFSGGIGTLEVVMFVAGWCFLFKKHGISASLEEGYRTFYSQFRRFSHNELKRATKNFSQVIGRGSFGAVYKGVLADDRVVAVKKLENMVQGEDEFWAEVNTIGRINHMNLASICGFCSEGKHRMLVYDYVENKSLEKHMFSSSSINNDTHTLLEWETRFKIALGTAKGLAYLHHECLEWVIHCDVKPENILLDNDFEPKISDFGLAKLCQRDAHSLSHLSKIRGTQGYMAPEWMMNLPLTAKIDVYSYGVLILELVRGIRLSSFMVDELGEEKITELTKLVRLAKGKMRDGEDLWMDNIVDPRLEGKFSKNQVAKVVEIGIFCVEDDPNKRPTMESIVQILQEGEDVTV